jgi:hypothetical protein
MLRSSKVALFVSERATIYKRMQGALGVYLLAFLFCSPSFADGFEMALLNAKASAEACAEASEREYDANRDNDPEVYQDYLQSTERLIDRMGLMEKIRGDLLESGLSDYWAILRMIIDASAKEKKFFCELIATASAEMLPFSKELEGHTSSRSKQRFIFELTSGISEFLLRWIRYSISSATISLEHDPSLADYFDQLRNLQSYLEKRIGVPIENIEHFQRLRDTTFLDFPAQYRYFESIIDFVQVYNAFIKLEDSTISTFNKSFVSEFVKSFDLKKDMLSALLKSLHSIKKRSDKQELQAVNLDQIMIQALPDYSELLNRNGRKLLESVLERFFKEFKISKKGLRPTERNRGFIVESPPRRKVISRKTKKEKKREAAALLARSVPNSSSETGQGPITPVIDVVPTFVPEMSTEVSGLDAPLGSSGAGLPPLIEASSPGNDQETLEDDSEKLVEMELEDYLRVYRGYYRNTETPAPKKEVPVKVLSLYGGAARFYAVAAGLTHDYQLRNRDFVEFVKQLGGRFVKATGGSSQRYLLPDVRGEEVIYVLFNLHWRHGGRENFAHGTLRNFVGSALKRVGLLGGAHVQVELSY